MGKTNYEEAIEHVEGLAESMLAEAEQLKKEGRDRAAYCMALAVLNHRLFAEIMAHAQNVIDRTSGLDEYTVPVAGEMPLKFRGRLIAEGSSRRAGGPLAARWHELDLFLVSNGSYVLAWRYKTTWQPEQCYETALVGDTPGHLAERIKRYDPVAYLIGYPVGEYYVERNRRLKLELRAGYLKLVGELFADAGPEFAQPVGNLSGAR